MKPGGITAPSAATGPGSGSHITACIVCRNEADRIEECLTSVAWVDEIVVMDLSSTDESAALARQHGARVISRSAVPIVELVRNEVASHARGDWILVLDPDERVTPGLARALRSAAADEQWHAVVMPRTNCDLGYPPSNPKERYEPQLRMYRRGYVTWPELPNALPAVQPENRLELPSRDEYVLLHHRNRNVAEALDRVIRYAPAEGTAWFQQGRPFTARAMLLDLGTQTYRQLIWGRAWRDGVPGILRVGLVLAFRFYTWAAFWQASGGHRSPADDRLLRRLGLLIEPFRAALRLGQLTHDAAARLLRRRTKSNRS